VADINKPFEVKMKDAMKDVTLQIKVKGTTTFGWRMKLAIWFIRIAACVCPIDTTVNTSVHTLKK